MAVEGICELYYQVMICAPVGDLEEILPLLFNLENEK